MGGEVGAGFGGEGVEVAYYCCQVVLEGGVNEMFFRFVKNDR